MVLAIGGCIEAGTWWVFALFALVTAIGLYEVVRMFRLAGKNVHPALVYGTGGVIYVALDEFFLGLQWIGWTLLPIVGAWCVGMLLGAWQLRREAAAAQNQAELKVAPIAEPQTAADKAEAVNKASSFNIAWSLWAAVYVALPLSLLTLLSELVMLWPLFIVIWTNDVFAYLVGCSFKAEKRHALAPRISPNKSWEGAVGGFVAALLAGALWAYCTAMPGVGFVSADIAAWMIFAAVISVSSILGDLLESYYKRKAALKDSGVLLGGHGGVLDRFDSVLLAAPTVVVLLVTLLWLLI